MLEVMDNLLIDFYSETEGAARIAWPPDSPQNLDPVGRRFSDALLFGCYALRQLRNLGPHPSAAALAEALVTWNYPPLLNQLVASDGAVIRIQAAPFHVMLRAVSKMRGLRERNYTRYSAPLWLVPYAGPGRLSFTGRLGRDPKQRLVFKLYTHGFNLLGLGPDVLLYASDSVLLLLAYLVQANRDASDFLPRLRDVAADCARIIQSRNPMPRFYEELALAVTTKHLRPIMEAAGPA